MREKKRVREWLVIIGIVLVAHLLLFLYSKPGLFSIFRKDISASSSDGSEHSMSPYAIITIEIDERDAKDQKAPITKQVETKLTPDEVTVEEAFEAASSDGASRPSMDVEQLLGETPRTLPGGSGVGSIMIPPRPVEITWPDVSDLDECLGHHIDVKIHVGADGGIIEAIAEGEGHPPECVQAALDSANRIVFQPGEIDGKPTPMWTHVRIDFKRRR
jgi:hypothetical protein